jgi:hypothetical protein
MTRRIVRMLFGRSRGCISPGGKFTLRYRNRRNRRMGMLGGDDNNGIDRLLDGIGRLGPDEDGDVGRRGVDTMILRDEDDSLWGNVHHLDGMVGTMIMGDGILDLEVPKVEDSLDLHEIVLLPLKLHYSSKMILIGIPLPKTVLMKGDMSTMSRICLTINVSGRKLFSYRHEPQYQI